MAKELGVFTAALNKYFFALYHVTQWFCQVKFYV